MLSKTNILDVPKRAQHHAVSFYFFFEKFENVTNMSVLLTTETELGQKIQ